MNSLSLFPRTPSVKHKNYSGNSNKNVCMLVKKQKQKNPQKQNNQKKNLKNEFIPFVNDEVIKILRFCDDRNIMSIFEMK